MWNASLLKSDVHMNPGVPRGYGYDLRMDPGDKHCFVLFYLIAIISSLSGIRIVTGNHNQQ